MGGTNGRRGRTLGCHRGRARGWRGTREQAPPRGAFPPDGLPSGSATPRAAATCYRAEASRDPRGKDPPCGGGGEDQIPRHHAKRRSGTKCKQSCKGCGATLGEMTPEAPITQLLEALLQAVFRWCVLVALSHL